METIIMAEPALVLSPASAVVAARANPGPRRTATPLRLRCRADAASDQVDAAPQASGEAEDTADHTGFSMVGVAG
jgi:hypothetical protein